MSQVRRECEHVPTNGGAGRGRRLKSPGGQGMAKIVEARAGASMRPRQGIHMHPEPTHDLVERATDGRVHQAGASSGHEERGGRLRNNPPAHAVRSKRRSGGRVDWDQPGLTELRLANGETVGGQVAELKRERLADAKPCGDQEREDRPVGVRARSPRGPEATRSAQYQADLGLRVDVRAALLIR